MAATPAQSILGVPATNNDVYAYAVGYHYGRNVGDEEPGRTELGEDFHYAHGRWYREGYERGVADYAEQEGE